MKTKHSGKIEGAKELGVIAEDVAVAAASGALKGAGESSSIPLKTVRNAFTKTIHGVKVGPQEPELHWLSNN